MDCTVTALSQRQSSWDWRLPCAKSCSARLPDCCACI